jgi:ribosomal protein S18 acetylase RimI-like enzyme
MWFTAELNGQSAGLAKLNPEGEPNECMHIESMWVDPKFRRTGVAKALVAALEREAALLGETQLALWVFEANWLARDLYVSLGYKGPRRKQSLRTTEGVLIEEEYLKPLAPQDGD